METRLQLSRLNTIEAYASEISSLISEMVVVHTFTPHWEAKFGWRHRDEQRDVFLYWLTKLAGSASSINAAVLLGKAGYWFQVAILARSINEALSSITRTLPKPGMKSGEWPDQKQQDAIDNHFKETWSDPDRPFQDTRLRPPIRNVAAAIGSYHYDNEIQTSSDVTQFALQFMRLLSDYTHMAYPQLMELFDAEKGYVLSGGQQTSSFNEVELGRLLYDCSIKSDIVSEILKNVYVRMVERGRISGLNSKKLKRMETKLEELTSLNTEFERVSTELEAEFPSPEDEVKKLVRQYRKRK